MSISRGKILLEIINKKFPHPLSIAEIGVFEGKTAGVLLKGLEGEINRYVMVDPFKTYNSYNDESKDIRASEKKLIAAEKILTKNILNNYGNSELIKEFSIYGAKLFPDDYFDVVFIDANHTYSYVKQDIENWLPKVKKGGLLFGHDYGYPGLNGVKKAVDETFEKGKINLYDDYVWSVEKGY